MYAMFFCLSRDVYYTYLLTLRRVTIRVGWNIRYILKTEKS